jgi:SAM-dependent methyltransferase
MDPARVKEHWRDWARRFETDVRATTKARSAKVLEIAALARVLESLELPDDREVEVLEVGCGNGHNCLSLARELPRFSFTGVDYVEEMVALAEESYRSSGEDLKLCYRVGDVRRLDGVPGLLPEYDVVLSVRCLINLASVEEQVAALRSLAVRLKPDGRLVLIENSVQTHAAQNDYRELLGLPRRTPAEFNVFLDETKVFPAVAGELELCAVEDFMSLHDLLLYVLIPATNGGEIDYEHPLVEAATALSLAGVASDRFGRIGQNRLFVLRRSGREA